MIKAKIAKGVDRLYKQLVVDHDYESDVYENQLQAFYQAVEVQFGSYHIVTYDWKEGGAEDEWISCVTKLGGIVVNDPMCEGTDTYGFLVFSPVFAKKRKRNNDNDRT